MQKDAPFNDFIAEIFSS